MSGLQPVRLGSPEIKKGAKGKGMIRRRSLDSRLPDFARQSSSRQLDVGRPISPASNFLEVPRGKSEPIDSPTSPLSPLSPLSPFGEPTPKIPDDAVAALKQRFSAFAESSGVLMYPQFVQMLSGLYKIKLPKENELKRFNLMWREIDVEQSGSVNFEAFCDWYMKYFDPISGDLIKGSP
jgi:hypothetical protein